MYLVNYKLRWLLSCLIFLAACKNQQQVNTYVLTKEDSLKEELRVAKAFIKVDSATAIIKTGDLIVRTGNDFTSESLRGLNRRDKTYSHCGIASIEHDTVFVYHALGGDWNPDQKIRRDFFKFFAEPYSNRGIAIYRYTLQPSAIDSLMLTVKKLYNDGIMFDMKFDLQTNDRMYCAEFVYKAYRNGTNGRLQFDSSRIDNFIFVGVDDLFLQPLCHLQKKILYNL
jgi:Permuted papain-like amidase enzyme, YaeF/YiiX, C92 family